MPVRVGTSGWNYPQGRGTWNGVFYPAKRTRGFDELAYYAEHFDTVEVNSTFYRVPPAAHVEQWRQRTPPSFGFSVKLNQKFTHPELYAARGGASDWHVTPGDVDEFRIAIDPLAAAGRLLALLVQFPPSFQCGTESLDYVGWLADAFSAYPLAVELRHRSWSDRGADTAARLAAHGAAWVQIDEPKFAGSIEQSLAWEQHGSSLVYVRLHGRNAAAWWTHEQADDRYDYLYRPDELRPFADAARRAATGGRRVLMYLNNHFSAKAVANAAVLKSQLGQLVTGEYPRQIVERYPELAGIVATSGLPL
ncbi:MAG: DUF72 domain-containing protein [Acidobacteria bacterium]|nr:DUF72 domain-containing protein [Acidobacteriota bacterium]